MGLVLILTGVNVGFSSLGTLLGSEIAAGAWRWLLVPVAMLMAGSLSAPSPPSTSLNKQVEEMSAGATLR